MHETREENAQAKKRTSYKCAEIMETIYPTKFSVDMEGNLNETCLLFLGIMASRINGE
jgi:hypothetical protein